MLLAIHYRVRYVLFAIVLSIPLMASAMSDATLKSKLEKIQYLLSQDGSSAAGPGDRYQLEFDAAFPCAVTITETSNRSGNAWRKQYRFALEDMQPGQRFMAREQRRAIVYRASVRYATGERRQFSDKRINNFLLHMNDTARQSEADRLIDELIVECRERHEF